MRLHHSVRILSFFVLALQAPLLWAYSSHDKPEDQLASEVKNRCESAKEFITTYEYLREHKELGLDEKRSKEAAHRVSQGCTGAAKRFVKIFEVLQKAEVGSRGALRLAMDLATKDDVYADTFITVFTKSYLSEYLDLDYKTSFDLAKRLSLNYKGHPKIAAEDFNQLVEFCISESAIGLSKPRCGVIAGRIVKSTEKFQARIAEEFKKLYRFLTSEKNGPSAPVLRGLQVAEDIVAQGPEAADNFILAYQYGVKKDGLDLTAEESLQLAKNISRHTWLNTRDAQESPKSSMSNRVPAADDENLVSE